MKILLHLVLLSSLFFAVQGCAALRDVPPLTPIRYQETINLAPSYDTRTLYLNAKRWFTLSFYYPDYVIRMDEPEEIIGRGVTYLNIPTGREGETLTVPLNFIIDIRFKAGRYKYDIGTLTIGQKEIPAEIAANEKRYKKSARAGDVALAYHKEIDRVMPLIIASLKSQMQVGTITGDDKW